MPAATVPSTTASSAHKRRFSSEDVSPLPRPKRAKPSSHLHTTSGQTSFVNEDLHAYHERRSLRQAFKDVPDCSVDARDRVEFWVATDQPGYSSALPKSRKDSQEYRRLSKASKGSRRSVCRAPTEATSANAESETGSSIKTIHNPRIRNILVDNGIHYEFSPDQRAQNHKEILRRLEQRRRSLSPSQGYPLDDEYENPNKDTLVGTAFMPYFHRGLKPCGLNSPFAALATLTEERLPHPKSDIYFGEAYTSLHPEARKACERMIVPYARTPYLLINQTTELKGIDGKGDVARTQVMYNGATGARAMDSLRYFANPQTGTLDSRARTHGATFANGCLSIYDTHSKPSVSGYEIDYVTQQVAGEIPTASAQQYRRAQTLYRNQCDVAREDREKAIADANARCHNVLAISQALSRSSTKYPEADVVLTPVSQASPTVLADVQDSHARWLKSTMIRLRAAGYSYIEAIRTALLSADVVNTQHDRVDSSGS